MTISKETINHVCNTDESDFNDPGAGAVELAIKYSIQEADISGDKDNEAEDGRQR